MKGGNANILFPIHIYLHLSNLQLHLNVKIRITNRKDRHKFLNRF